MSLLAIANTAVNHATATAAKKPGAFDWFFSPEFVVLVFRLMRFGSVIMIIFFVNMMLIGAFEQMNSSGKDDVVRKGRGLIAKGFLGAMTMIMLFFIASGAIAKLGP